MKTLNLDILEKSHLPPAQARAILEVMESEMAMRDTALVTKSDLLALKVDIREELHAIGLKIDGLREDFRVESHCYRTEMQSIRAELKGDILGTVRWNFAFWVAQLGALAGVLKLLK
jgi:hypothetical protein